MLISHHQKGICMNFSALLLIIFTGTYSYFSSAAFYENRSLIRKKPKFSEKQSKIIIAANKPQASPLIIQQAACIWASQPEYEFSPGKASELYEKIGQSAKAQEYRIKQAQRCISLLPDHLTQSNRFTWNLAHKKAIKWISLVIDHETDPSKKEYLSKHLEIFKTYVVS